MKQFYLVCCFAYCAECPTYGCEECLSEPFPLIRPSGLVFFFFSLFLILLFGANRKSTLLTRLLLTRSHYSAPTFETLNRPKLARTSPHPLPRSWARHLSTDIRMANTPKGLQNAGRCSGSELTA